MGKGIVLAAWALGLTMGPLCAQTVGGVVLEEGTGSPVDGAMVILMAPDGRVVRRVLSDAAGRFTMSSDGPGPHLIRIDRIGYESLTTTSFDVPRAGAFQRVEVPVRPVQLRGLSVEGATRCQLRPEQGISTARVWEEARKALEAAAWTQESGRYRYTLLKFERREGARQDSVSTVDEQTTTRWGQAPYRSAPADSLVGDGFIRGNDDGTLTYFVPDADVLLSDVFLDSHCMRLEPGSGGMVGLDFEPISGRDRPDIEGTLWLDAATAALRRMDFRYLHHPAGGNVGEPGGAVAFARLPNGAWIVRDWSVRMPLLARARVGDPPQVTGYLVQGGSLRRATARDGSTVLEAAMGTVLGTVFDSLDAGPLAGGFATVLDNPDGARIVPIDSAGGFTLSGLTEGSREVSIEHPSLDTLGLAPPSFRVPAVAGEAVAARYRLPGVAETLRKACSDERGKPLQRGAILYGRVRSGSASAAGARVRVRWLRSSDVRIPSIAAPAGAGFEALVWTADPDDPHAVLTTVDGRGTFLVCGLPKGAQMVVEAQLGAATSSGHDISIAQESDVRLETIRVEPRP